MNAFDKIAKKKTAAPSKSTKIAAEVTDEIKVAVDRVIQIKGQVADLLKEQGGKEDAIRAHVLPQQDQNAYDGNFSKSFDVAGNDGSLVYTTSDSFSVPQDEEPLDAIRKLIGTKTYDEFFGTKRVASLKADVLKDDKQVNKIIEVLSKAGINDIFEVTDTVIAKDDLDRKQYDLTPDKLEVFRTLVHQKKASLKY